MGDDGAARRSSFWTTLPGILTGLAALVTALVGAAALFSHSGDTPQSPASGSHVGVATASSSAPTRAPTSASAPNAAPSVDATTASTISRFVLNAGDWLDVETRYHRIQRHRWRPHLSPRRVVPVRRTQRRYQGRRGGSLHHGAAAQIGQLCHGASHDPGHGGVHVDTRRCARRTALLGARRTQPRADRHDGLAVTFGPV